MTTIRAAVGRVLLPACVQAAEGTGGQGPPRIRPAPVHAVERAHSRAGRPWYAIRQSCISLTALKADRVCMCRHGAPGASPGGRHAGCRRLLCISDSGILLSEIPASTKGVQEAVLNNVQRYMWHHNIYVESTYIFQPRLTRPSYHVWHKIVLNESGPHQQQWTDAVMPRTGSKPMGSEGIKLHTLLSIAQTTVWLEGNSVTCTGTCADIAILY